VTPVCDAPSKPNVARCLAVRRTDVAAHRGVVANDTPAGYGPADLRSAYNLPTDAGTGQTVAIVDAYDDPNAEADLAVYRAQYGLPACTTANGCFTKVNQTGEQGSYPPASPQWAGEISLDVDMVSAICPQCHILLVETDTPIIDDLGIGVNTAVALGAKYVSNSYGLNENSGVTSYDSYFDHVGVAITVSSGDGGYGVEWPAASPHVTAVGGTSLVRDTGTTRGWSESVWSGAGSGCSQYEDKQSFQTDPGCAKRTVADVSAVADPNTGVAVYQTYGHTGWAVSGGTSVGAPIIASVYALAGTPNSDTYPNRYPYESRSALNDVTTGSNGSCGDSYLCTGKPGYDGPSGLGSPDGPTAFSAGLRGTLTGTVTDSGTGAPITGAKVSAGDSSRVTGTDGKYSLSLRVGSYDVTASAYGYQPATKSGLKITDGATTTGDFAITALPKVSVGGTVTDGSGHAWPLYAKITVDGTPGAPVFTNPFTGHYSMHLPAGATYTMHVSPVHPGYLTRDLTLKVGTTDLVQNVAALADPTACETAPGYQFTYTGLPLEPFNDPTAPPAGWTAVNAPNTKGGWEFDDPGNRGNLTGGSGGFAIVDSAKLGYGTENTQLITRPIDLSNVTDPVIGFDTHDRFDIHQTADVDVSTDGGTTWTNVWEQTGHPYGSISGPQSVDISKEAAGKSNVQVRFHFIAFSAAYWEVDNVFVGNRSCEPVPGGLVSGFTTDANTGDALDAATVTSDDHPVDQGVSAKTPDDGNIPDGFYSLFSPLTGLHPFTATLGKYRPATKATDVQANNVTRLNLALGAGRLVVTSGPVKVTERMGVSQSRKVTFHNVGTQPVQVTLGERDAGFQVNGGPAQAVYAGVPGAPVQHVPGTYLPTPMAGQNLPKAAEQPAVTPSDAPWQAIADYPMSIADNAVAAQDGKVYSVGGFDGTAHVAKGYVYDPASTTWSPMPDMSTPRDAAGAAFVNGKLYIVGGWGPYQNPVGLTEIYDPGSNSWTTGAANPKPHAGAGVGVVNGKIYVVGGCNAACGNTDVQVYDPASDSWSSAAAYPGAISWLACGGIAGELYCAGGHDGVNASSKAYAYYPGSNSWSPVADMPAADWAAGYAAADDQLLVSGGVIGTTTLTNQGWAF
ncbi:MAG: hypothetical protein QOI26_2609, partial [Pseudonocardiales bacterium]|nr:hypothetical protein [Pseudonocardiales bacterium]